MRLLRYRVTNFRSVEDSGWIDADDVTALIGVNESGKSNLLLPLWKLKPAREGEIRPTSDYPKTMFAEIREKFQQRRAKGASRLDLALRKLLGLDAKLRQYRDGERFVRAVVDQVGMDGFNRVWTSPNTLPTKAEIAKPADWVARMHRKAES